MLRKILGSLLRHGATALGGIAAVGDGDDMQRIAGLAVAALGAIVSLVKAVREAKDEADTVPKISR